VSHLRKNLLIKEPTDVIDLKYSDDSRSDVELLYRDGGTIFIIKNNLLMLKSDLE
jgi:hypothetical protein